MTTAEAVKVLTRIPSGTIAAIIGTTKYERIDDAVNSWILTVTRSTDPADLIPCKTWTDILDTIGATRKERKS